MIKIWMEEHIKVFPRQTAKVMHTYRRLTLCGFWVKNDSVNSWNFSYQNCERANLYASNTKTISTQATENYKALKSYTKP